MFARIFGLLALIATAGVLTPPARAQAPEPRIALVIGNADYSAGALATPANDAGLIADTLRQAGFDVTGARDLDQASIRGALADFVAKAQASGPDTIAFVYLAGYGLQYNGDNYFVPVDATIARATDVPLQAVRVADFTASLGGVPLKAAVLVLDAARATPFAAGGAPLAGGLALTDPPNGWLYAYNAAPGTIGPNEQGPYGAYAEALTEMMGQGYSVNDVFDRVLLRVNQLTGGVEVPWSASRLTSTFSFFERAPNAPPLTSSSQQIAALMSGPIASLPVAEAYTAALERDTINGYEDFLAAYGDDPLASRIRALLAARREAETWESAIAANTPAAYWTYIRRYPNGPHVADAERRLTLLRAALQPPPGFTLYSYDVSPPPPDEESYFTGPVIVLDEPDYVAPPPPPSFFLPPRSGDFDHLPPPPPPRGLGFLPIPLPIPFQFSRPFHREDQDRRASPTEIPLPRGIVPPRIGAPPRFTAGPKLGQQRGPAVVPAQPGAPPVDPRLLEQQRQQQLEQQRQQQPQQLQQQPQRQQQQQQLLDQQRQQQQQQELQQQRQQQQQQLLDQQRQQQQQQELQQQRQQQQQQLEQQRQQQQQQELQQQRQQQQQQLEQQRQQQQQQELQQQRQQQQQQLLEQQRQQQQQQQQRQQPQQPQAQPQGREPARSGASACGHPGAPRCTP